MDILSQHAKRRAFLKLAARKLVLYSAQGAEGSATVDAKMRTLFASANPRVSWVPPMPDDDGAWYRDKVPYYKALGITLGPFVPLSAATPADQIEQLLSGDGIHLSGGWTPGLLKSLRNANLVDRIRAFVARGGVLIGESAGSIVMTPDIQTAFVGTYADGYPDLPFDYGALGLVDWWFWPHYRKADEASARDFAKRHKVSLFAAEDGGAIVVDGDSVTPFGPVQQF